MNAIRIMSPDQKRSNKSENDRNIFILLKTNNSNMEVKFIDFQKDFWQGTIFVLKMGQKSDLRASSRMNNMTQEQ